MEVLFGLAQNLGYSEDDFIKKRLSKRNERGGLGKRENFLRYMKKIVNISLCNVIAHVEAI